MSGLKSIAPTIGPKHRSIACWPLASTTNQNESPWDLRLCIDPFTLSDTIDRQLLALQTMTCRPPDRSLATPKPGPRPIAWTFHNTRKRDRMMRKALQGDYFKTFIYHKRRLASVTS